VTALALGLLLVPSVVPCGPAPSPAPQALLAAEAPREALKRLDAHLAAGDAAAAAALLGRLAPELERDERLALDAAYVLVDHRRFAEAREQWSRAARRVQESVASGPARTEAAERELQRRVAEALFVQGLITARLGPKDEALELLRKADGYGFPPLDSRLMVLAGDCLLELGESDLAAQAYREVVSRAPENAAARLRLGIALYSSGQVGAAERELAEALRRAPALPRARFYLGAALFELKRPGEAREQLERELLADPRCSGCMGRLAHIAYLDGRDAECESWLARALALEKDDVEANLVSGMLANRTGRYAQAIEPLARVVAQAPEYAKAQYQLALAYERSGNAVKAREHREAYARLVQAQKARTLGVRGSKEE
jgi:tetratricopeptide (TPR) repeat protein